MLQNSIEEIWSLSFLSALIVSLLLASHSQSQVMTDASAETTMQRAAKIAIVTIVFICVVSIEFFGKEILFILNDSSGGLNSRLGSCEWNV